MYSVVPSSSSRIGSVWGTTLAVAMPIAVCDFSVERDRAVPGLAGLGRAVRRARATTARLALAGDRFPERRGLPPGISRRDRPTPPPAPARASGRDRRGAGPPRPGGRAGRVLGAGRARASTGGRDRAVGRRHGLPHAPALESVRAARCREVAVEGGDQVKGQQQGRGDAADDDDRQGLLRLRADRGGEGGREQAEDGRERGHGDRAEPAAPRPRVTASRTVAPDARIWLK